MAPDHPLVELLNGGPANPLAACAADANVNLPPMHEKMHQWLCQLINSGADSSRSCLPLHRGVFAARGTHFLLLYKRLMPPPPPPPPLLCGTGKRREGAGTAVGEPPESVWSRAGRLGKRLKYCSVAKKHAVIEAYIMQHNAQKDVRTRRPCPPSSAQRL
jgi:hypothetical protein